jgi:RimJ/RimL family protein N-acetyltransferase
MYDLELICFDDPRYRFFFSSDYRGRLETDNGGWSSDTFCIYKNDKAAGFIHWTIDRKHEAIDNVSCILYPEYLNSGIGIVALAKWLIYVFDKRGMRKVIFSSFGDGTTTKIYNRSIGKIGGRIVGTYKEDLKLSDGKYYDLHKYEILKKEFKIEHLEAISSLL